MDLLLRWTCAAVSATAVALAVLFVLPRGLAPRPEGGERGYRRSEALRNIPGFAWFELVLRAMAQIVSRVRAPAIRVALERRLEDAGRPLGLDSDELVSVCWLSSVFFAVAGCVASMTADRSVAGASLVAGLFGLALPLFRVDELVRQRRLTVSRTLPAVIDLIALSMEAGLDFGRAVSEVERRLHRSSPLRFELEHLRHKLALGWSRREALEDLARRVPTPPVRQFITAVIQGELRGTPLAQVLSVQASVMRTKRSQAAEQAASRAGVLILLPLLLIFCAVFVVLLGPFAVKFIRGEVM